MILLLRIDFKVLRMSGLKIPWISLFSLSVCNLRAESLFSARKPTFMVPNIKFMLSGWSYEIV